MHVRLLNSKTSFYSVNSSWTHEAPITELILTQTKTEKTKQTMQRWVIYGNLPTRDSSIMLLKSQTEKKNFWCGNVHWSKPMASAHYYTPRGGWSQERCSCCVGSLGSLRQLTTLILPRRERWGGMTVELHLRRLPAECNTSQQNMSEASGSRSMA